MSSKDPIAAELGRRGGIKGGKARSKSLSPERRRDIARRAAAARWGSKVVNGAAEGAKASLPGVAAAIQRATLHLGEMSFEAFALADGRKLLGLLSVEAALADGRPEAAPVVVAEHGLVTFKEAGSWQVSKGVTSAEFLALCRRLGGEALAAQRPAAHRVQQLGRILAVLLDCAEDGLERRLTTALAAN